VSALLNLDPPRGLRGKRLFRALADSQARWIEHCEKTGAYEQTESKTARGIDAQRIREADETAYFQFLAKGARR